MGGVGALIAAARETAVASAVAISAPADPHRLTRLTFRLARLPLPTPVAIPLAWVTARVFVRPRGHALADISAARAVARYRGALLLVHGTADEVVPIDHLGRLAAAARRARRAPGPAGDPRRGIVRAVAIDGGDHSYLYERREFRRILATFLGETLGGPYASSETGDRAAALEARRLPEPDLLTGLDAGPIGARALAALVVPRRARSALLSGPRVGR
jgi:dipeptidyl aminopeptidase/acylaminoacyl peptidase